MTENVGFPFDYYKVFCAVLLSLFYTLLFVVVVISLSMSNSKGTTLNIQSWHLGKSCEIKLF